eukprot:352237-Chlamydomonas_euryale.AAC.2
MSDTFSSFTSRYSSSPRRRKSLKPHSPACGVGVGQVWSGGDLIHVEVLEQPVAQGVVQAPLVCMWGGCGAGVGQVWNGCEHSFTSRY